MDLNLEPLYIHAKPFLIKIRLENLVDLEGLELNNTSLLLIHLVDVYSRLLSE